MSSHKSITDEQYHEHGRTLRALARAIVGDAGTAEDVVQDAWLLALEKPPATQDRFGGWLNTVVQSLAFKRLRGERRRAYHEQTAAMGESAGAIERAELCKQLVEAVLQLKEPTRSTISMRYFDGMPPREIARKLDIPKNTVRARLQRGLAELRVRLDQDSEGGRAKWAPACIALAGGGPEALAASVGAGSAAKLLGVVAMTGVGKWIVGLIVAVAVGLGLFEYSNEPTEPLSRDAVEAARLERAPADMSSVPALVAEDRREPMASGSEPVMGNYSPAGVAPAQASKKYPFEIRARVVDAWRQPNYWSRLHIAVDGHRFNVAPVREAGSLYVARFEANQPSLDVHVYVSMNETLSTGVRTVSVNSGEPTHLHYDLKKIMSEGGPSRSHVAPLDTAPFINVEPGLSASFVSESGLLTIDEEPMIDDLEVQFEDHAEVVELEESELCTLRGVVKGADGRPAARARIRARLDGKLWTQSVSADSQGRWILEHLDPGKYALEAGGDEFGLANAELVIESGQVRDWNVQLDRGRELRGRLIGPGGEPLQRVVRVEPLDSALDWSDTTVSNERGEFAFPNARTSSVRMMVLGLGARMQNIPLASKECHLASGDPLLWQFDERAMKTASLSLTLFDPQGRPVTDAEVRVHHLASRCGEFLEPDSDEDSPGRYLISGLPAGSYRLEAGSVHLGWLDAGTFTLRGGEDLDLGAFSFSQPGTLVVHSSGPDFGVLDDLEVVELGASADSIASQGFGYFAFAEEDDARVVEFQLPAGRYMLGVGGVSIGRAWFPFDVQSGGRTDLELPFEQLTLIRFQNDQEVAPSDVGFTIFDAESGARVNHAWFESLPDSWEVSLLPGRYRLQLGTPGGESIEQTFEVVEGREQRIPVTGD